MDSSPLPNSFYSPRGPCTGIGEFTKKRKVRQYELGNSCFPFPKQKIRDQSGTFDHVPLIPKSLNKENSMDELIDREICGGLEVESENDSNSLIEGPDNKMTFEVNTNTGGSSANLEHASQPAGFDSSYDEFEHCKRDPELEDETTDDLMLYSNDVAPFLLASGGWSIGQDARLGTRKPTIDQEFEQYFSALMLS